MAFTNTIKMKGKSARWEFYLYAPFPTVTTIKDKSIFKNLYKWKIVLTYIGPLL